MNSVYLFIYLFILSKMFGSTNSSKTTEIFTNVGYELNSPSKVKCNNSSAWAPNSWSSFHNQSASHKSDVWVSYVRPIEREKSRSRRSLREGEREIGTRVAHQSCDQAQELNTHP